MTHESLESAIHRQIANSVSDYRLIGGARTIWREPLVAYASAHDPLFDRLKDVVSPTHTTPREVLPGAETVIVYFLPFEEYIVESNADPGPASAEWAIAYVETNRLLTTINEQLAQSLEQDGYAAVTIPPTGNFDAATLTSDWSHKHVGYIAGLGTFGLHHMLITAAGCAGRLSSLVTNAHIPPTLRPTSEACLYRHDGSCRACVDRCTFGALMIDGLDRRRCYDVCLENVETHTEQLQRELSPPPARSESADVCGKCASAVPCSFINPVAARMARL